jgi:hypothetical protein
LVLSEENDKMDILLGTAIFGVAGAFGLFGLGLMAREVRI